jgi:hypothetical protein
MADPVLDAHRRATFYYTISGPLPISIRDQILRGLMIVDRLQQVQEIGPQRQLLVIGAGAAGATAAIEAARRGVPTFLVERADNAFLRQVNTSTRVLDPTQYDWPVDHYNIGHFPWGRQPSCGFRRFRPGIPG